MGLSSVLEAAHYQISNAAAFPHGGPGIIDRIGPWDGA